ncbi:MAG: hypothetical protein SGBAC_006733 [Bacillariaceae sp.]
MEATSKSMNTTKQRRISQTPKGTRSKLVFSPRREKGGGEGVRRRASLSRLASLQRLALSADDEDESPTPDELTSQKEPVVLSAELVHIEPVEIIAKPKKKTAKRRSLSRSQRQEVAEEQQKASFSRSKSKSKSRPSNSKQQQSNTTAMQLTKTPKYPRSFLGMVIRLVKILHALLNIIVVRGSVLTRRKLHGKLDDYLLSPQPQQHEVIAMYEEHISHHLFVYYLSWGRLLVCLIVLMWGTCTSRLPRPIAIYIGMAMHWIDSIRALDPSHWLPETTTGEEDAYRSSTAEEEVQTAMAWLHLFWFLVDGLYCRQIIKKRKYEEERIQRELYLSLTEEDEEDEYTANKQNKRD